MLEFKKSGTITGTAKSVFLRDGKFIDEETGEEIDVLRAIEAIMGDHSFDLKVTQKIEMDEE